MIITPSGNMRTYQDFKKQIPGAVQPLFDKIRDYCLALDSKVIEDVRMHRVVFCKSMTFRWFLDVEPQQDCIILKIQKDRKTPIRTITVKEIAEEQFKQIKQAFDSIR